MSRSAYIAIACLVFAASACDKPSRETPPALPPVIPPAPVQHDERPPVVLVEPEEAPRPAVEPSEVAAPAVEAGPATVSIDMGELGKHVLITWPEAKRLAEAEITVESADQDLAKMRNEIPLGARKP